MSISKVHGSTDVGALLNQPVASINTLPIDLILPIFSSLSRENLVQCSRVCHSWNAVVKNSGILYPTEIVDDFSPLILEKFLDWNEVYLYAPLSNLMNKAMQSHNCNNWFIKKENPELSQEQFPSCIIRNVFARCGNYSFSISNSIHIKVHRRGGNEPSILKGEAGKMVICLAAEGDALFALRKDGMIIQWDYKEQKIVNQIFTAYAKESEELRGIKENFLERFKIKNGRIFLFYYSTKVLEIISIESQKSQLLLLNTAFFGCTSTIVEKNRFAILYRNYVEIKSFNDLTSSFNIEFDMDTTNYIIDIDLRNNILYAVDTSRNWYMVDLITRNEEKFVFTEGNGSIDKIQVIENLLFGIHGKTIVIFDIETRKLIEQVEFKIDSLHMDSDVFNKLVKIAKNNIRHFKPEIKDKQICVIT